MYARSITNEKCITTSYNNKNALYLDIKRAIFIYKKRDSAKAKPYRLGTIWKMLDPLLKTMIYYFVFTVIRFNTNVGTLMVGLALIHVLTENLTKGVKQMDFFGLKIERIPTRVIILSDLFDVISNSFIHSITTLLLLLYLDASLWTIPFVPPIFVFSGLTWFAIGKALLPIANRFPDFRKLVSYFSLMMFFISPALYPLSITKGFHRQLCLYNPFSYFSEPTRAIAFGDVSYQLLFPWMWGVIVFTTATLLFHGFWMVDKQRWKWSTWS